MMQRVLMAALVCAVAAPAFGQIANTESPLYPDNPPVAALIQISVPDTSGNVAITGKPGAVTSKSVVALVNLDTADLISLTAAADGSFQGSIFGPAGTSIQVKADPTGKL